jgi:hypothetical protein
MSTENNNVETPEVDLDDFATELFGGSKEAPDNAKSEEESETDEDVSNAPKDDDTHSEASEEEAHSEDNDDLATEEDENDDDTDESNDDEGKPKKTRFQKRIDELTAKAREAERDKEAATAAYEARIAALEAKLGQDDKTEDKSQKSDELVEPTPTDKTENGDDKYPLGEYDPQYMKDMAKYTFDREFAAREAARQQSEQESSQKEAAKRQEAEKQALQETWNEKLAPAQERYPDFEEKGQELVSAFDSIDASYGEYLSTALMALDNGPDVLYYLASNPEEAQAIVESGPMKATVAMGRIDSMFGEQGGKTNKTPPRKVSKAPAPPPRNKGSSVAKGSLNPSDEDVDLDALSRELAKGGY